MKGLQVAADKVEGFPLSIALFFFFFFFYLEVIFVCFGLGFFSFLF